MRRAGRCSIPADGSTPGLSFPQRGRRTTTATLPSVVITSPVALVSCRAPRARTPRRPQIASRRRSSGVRDRCGFDDGNVRSSRENLMPMSCGARRQHGLPLTSARRARCECGDAGRYWSASETRGPASGRSAIAARRARACIRGPRPARIVSHVGAQAERNGGHQSAVSNACCNATSLALRPG